MKRKIVYPALDFPVLASRSVARVVGPKNFFAMPCPVANVKDKFVAK